MLPKIHKQNNPGRPVISFIDCNTSNISQFVDYHLQDHVQKLPSYVKDTTDFINKIKDLDVPSNSILVTMDVSALYTNIPNNEGIDAVRNTLLKANIPVSLITVIQTFLTLILTLNNFVFNGLHYLQKKGCAMGTKCAPSYANLFMGDFEAKWINSNFKARILKYLRFLDDIFLIWTGSKDELDQFVSFINNVHNSIKFTVESSNTKVNFLDTTVYKKNSKLYTKTFKKPTDKPSYLHNTSYHPNTLKHNIAYGQALRLKKICTEEKEYEKSVKELNESLRKRGFQQQSLTNNIRKASTKKRENLLTYKTKLQTNRVPFITTFNKSLPKIKAAIEDNWNLLQINPNLSEIFKEKPILAYRRNRNLKDLIGQTTIQNNKVQRNKKNTQKGKCRPCLTKSNNLCCRQVKSATTFKSQQTNRSFDIFHNTNCRSSFVIYLMECRICHIQYVGKTETSFNVRLNNHRNNAYNPKPDTIPACKHFTDQQHDFNRDAKFTIIEQLTDLNKTREQKHATILKRENFWIQKLKTLKPNGLNQELNLI